MTYKGYFGKAEYDEDAGVIFGTVLGIRDVVTFEADNAKGIDKAFRESVDDYLAFCKSRGEQPNKPASGRFLVRVDPTVHARLSIVAQLAGVSLNMLVERALTDEADHQYAELEKTKTRPGALAKA